MKFHQPAIPLGMRLTLKAVLLDVDGTLLDSNEAHARSWVEVLKRNGHECAYERVRALIGMRGDKMLPKLVGVRPGAPGFATISKERTELFVTATCRA